MAHREGTAGRDRLLGTNLADNMEGKDGSDLLYGFADNDIMDGDLGNGYRSWVLIGARIGPGATHARHGKSATLCFLCSSSC